MRRGRRMEIDVFAPEERRTVYELPMHRLGHCLRMGLALYPDVGGRSVATYRSRAAPPTNAEASRPDSRCS